MNKTAKLLLSSVLTVCVCISLIASSTFALFTDESSVNVAVTSGKVEITAAVSIEEAWSAQYNSATNEYERKTATETDGIYTFANSGTVAIDGSKVALTNVTPGDGVKVKLQITNGSNVSVKYSVGVTSQNDTGLLAELQTKWSADVDGSEYEFGWKQAEAGVAIDPIYLDIELPIDAGNSCSGAGVDLYIRVLAVQGNATACDEVGGNHFFDATGQCIFCGKKTILDENVTHPTQPSNNSEWYAFRDAIKNAVDTVVDVTFTEDYAHGMSGAAAKFTVQNNSDVTLNLGEYHFLSSKYNNTSGVQITVNNASLTVNADTPEYSDTSIIYSCKSSVGNISADGSQLTLNGGCYTHYENIKSDSGLIEGKNGSSIKIIDGLFYAKTNKATGPNAAVIYSASGSQVNVLGGFYFGGVSGVFRANDGIIEINGDITFGGTGEGSGSAPWFCVENGGIIKIANTVTITYFDKTTSGYTKYTVTADSFLTELAARCNGTVSAQGDYYIIKAA